MRILIQNYYDSPVGGAESYLSNLIPALEEFGHHIVVVYTRSGERAPGVDSNNISTYYLPNLSKRPREIISSFTAKLAPYIKSGRIINVATHLPFLMIKTFHENRKAIMGDLKQFLEIIEKEKIDILFLNNFNGLFLFRSIGLPVPAVQMLHDYYWICPNLLKLIKLYEEDQICRYPLGPWCFKKNCFSPFSALELLNITWRYLYLKYLTRIPKRIVCASAFVKKAYSQNGIPQQKIDVIPLFTHPKSQTNNSSKTNKSERKILFIGRISYEKGLNYLLKAIPGLSDCILDIIGAGEDLSSVKILAKRLNLQNKVNFRGWMSHEALEPLIDEARLVVIPSIWPEPFGMVGLEAMAYGKPVVAFDIGGTREWLKDGLNGFLVPNKDIHQLKEKINLLLNDEDLAVKMGKAGAEFLKTSFNVRIYVNRLNEVFKKAITDA